jgi:enoyl-CoA hydratase
MTKVRIDRQGEVWTVAIARPEVRNAVDGPTARALAEAFRAFDADAAARVAVLHGEGGHFCAGADLRTVAGGRLGDPADPLALALDDDMANDGPMGPTRLVLGKPVVAAVEGYAVAGGIELALWCDLRVAAVTATFGVFCRRFGVPLIDGGTVRLPRLIGESRAMDLILTGRGVGGEEALAMGLVNRVADPGQALDVALELATELAAFPQTCLRGDRLSALEQWGLTEEEAMANELRHGLATIRSGETLAGAQRFSGGEGRHGRFG